VRDFFIKILSFLSIHSESPQNRPLYSIAILPV
jgi:hypothetical protein